eukprot:1329186-Pyramimonas_sp.AAC.1
MAAVTCLSYVGQLYEPPEALLVKEQRALHKILRVAPNSFSKSDIFGMTGWTRIEVPADIELTPAATTRRTATKTLTGLTKWYHELKDNAIATQGLVAEISGQWSAPCWINPISI